MLRTPAVVVCAVVCLLAACTSSPLPTGQVDGDASDLLASVAAQPGSKYCQAFEALLDAQPEGAMSDDELGAAMGTYADAVERVAEMSSADESVILWELAAVARLVAEDPGDNDTTKRLGQMFFPVAPITIRATSSCQLET